MNPYNENMAYVILSAVLSLAAVLRTFNWRPTFPEPGTVIFSFQDTYYHMRRVFLAYEDFPHLPVLDTYSNFPQGVTQAWPPLFDQMIIWLAWLIGLGRPSPHQIEMAGAILPPLLGVITIAILFVISARLFGKRAAVVAALLAAVMPAHVDISVLGRPDHHVAEILFILVAAGTFMLSVAAPAGKHIRSTALALFSGFALGAAILSSVVSIAFLGAGFLFIIWIRLLPLRIKNSGAQATRSYLWMMLAALLIVAPIALTSVRGLAGVVDYEHLSLFQPLVLILTLLLSGLLVMGDLLKSQPAGKRALAWIFVTAFVSGLVLFTLPQAVPTALKAAEDSLHFLIRRNLVLSTVSEARPLLSAGGSWNPLPALMLFALALPLLPLSAFLLIRQARSESSERRLSVHFLFSWTAVAILLMLFQIRFAAWVVMPLVLIHSAAIAGTWGEKKKPWQGWTLALVVLALPLAVSLEKALQTDWTPAKDTRKAFRWLREHTPEPGSYSKPDTEPAWGVLAPWDLGHLLLYTSHRPVISDNFLWNAHKAIDFLLSPNEEEAYTILADNRARFIYTPRLVPTGPWFLNYVQAHGETKEDYLTSRPGRGRRPVSAFKDRFFKTLYARLLLFDGNQVQHAGVHSSALVRIRLIYESAVAVIGVEKIPTRSAKIFEFVRGAQVVGNAPPGAPVLITCPVRTNHLRDLTWTLETTAGPDGVFSATLPYATHGTPYRTRPTGPYSVRVGDSVSTLEVTEVAVQSGATLYL